MNQLHSGAWLRRAVLLLVLVALLLPMAAANAYAPQQAGVAAYPLVDLRIRSGPGTGYSQLAVAPRGSALPVLGRSANSQWLLVQSGSVQGWSAAWLARVEGDLSTVPVPGGEVRKSAAAPAPASGVTAVPTVGLRLRSGPGTEHSVVGSVRAGAPLPVVGRDAAGAWLQVETGGARGWIAGWYTRPSGDLNAVPVGGAAGGAPSVAAPQPAAPVPAGDAGELLQRLNQTRCAQGLQPLVANPQLDAAAAQHTQDMVAHNFFSHTGSNGSHLAQRVSAQDYAFRAVGENLAAGNSTAGPTFDQWMNSPGHRDNMLNPVFTEVGFAHMAGPGTTYGHYWAMVLGARAGVAVPSCAALGY